MDQRIDSHVTAIHFPPVGRLLNDVQHVRVNHRAAQQGLGHSKLGKSKVLLNEIGCECGIERDRVGSVQ